MKKIPFLLLITQCLYLISFSQSIGIGHNAPAPSAILDVRSVERGILIPRMKTSERMAINLPAQGLMVYDNDINMFFYHTGSTWKSMQISGTIMDTDGDTKIMMEESTDEDIIRMHLAGAQSLVLRRNANGDVIIEPGVGIDENLFIGRGTGNVNTGKENTAVGDSALHSNTSGLDNTAFGYQALFRNTTGSVNTAIGMWALKANDNGTYNTAYGFNALRNNISGDENTSGGVSSLSTNTTGSNNTAYGYNALYYNKAGSNATAIGYGAMYNANNNTIAFTNANVAVGYYALRGGNPYGENNTGNYNTAVGYRSLYSNTSGANNTASGYQTLYSNSSGFSNTAIGYEALFSNTNGDENTAHGYNSLSSNNAGNANTGIGKDALLNNTSGDNNVAIGLDAGGSQITGSSCTFVGYSAEGSAGSFNNATAIGNQASVGGTNEVRIGNSIVTEIGGFEPWTNVSDGRFKKNISENVSGLDFILKLRPVTYNMEVNKLAAHLKEDDHRDSTGAVIHIAPDAFTQHSRDVKEQIVYTGFIAQEVEAAANSIAYDFSGISTPDNEDDLYGLSYAEFVVPLIKAMQEQQEMIKALESKNSQLEKSLMILQAEFNAKKSSN